MDGPRNSLELVDAVAGIVDGRKEFQVAAVGGVQHFAERAQPVGRFFIGTNFIIGLAIALFYPAVVLEGDVLRDFDTKDLDEFVVHFAGDHAHRVPNASGFDAYVVALAHFVLVVAV